MAKPTSLPTVVVLKSSFGNPPSMSAPGLVDFRVIRQQTNMAQRNDPRASRVQAIGAVDSQFPAISQYAGSSGIHTSLPSIGVPRGGQMVNNFNLLSNYDGNLVPAIHSQTPLGYNANHLNYQSQKANLAAVAYRPLSKKNKVINNEPIESIPLHASLHYEIQGKTKTELVHTIHRGFPNISAHIGTLQSKQYIYDALIPMFISWAGFSLPIHELRLVHPTLYEILDDNLQTEDAIWLYIWAKNSKGANVLKVSVKQPLSLLLVMSPETWNEVCQRMKKSELSSIQDNLGWKPPSIKSIIGSLGKEKDSDIINTFTEKEPCEDPIYTSTTTRPSTPPNRKRSHIAISPSTPPIKRQAVANQWKSPDRTKLTEALSLAPLTESVLQDYTHEATIYPIPQLEFNDLVATNGHTNLLNNFGRAIIFVTKNSLGSGTFKTCNLARLLVTMKPKEEMKWLPDDQLVSKRFYRLIDGNVGKTIVRMPGVADMCFAATEANALIWAKSLMQMAYCFIDSIQLLTSLIIPRVKFVTAVLAHTHKEGVTDRSMIIEEYIDPVKEGPFRKFILNSNAIPIPREGEPDFELAQFLSFVQHIQWDKTGGLAFISDFQGGNNTLSDPQIMTHPALKAKFGDGNVPDCFKQFPDEHECNHYCTAFKLSEPRAYNPTIE